MALNEMRGRPENSHYDQSRHQKMRLKEQRYGFFSVPHQASCSVVCDSCGKEVIGHSTKIDSQVFCDPCMGKPR